MAELKHLPSVPDSDGIVHCLQCHQRIFRNGAGIVSTQPNTAWAHVGPTGSEVMWRFTCPGSQDRGRSLADLILGAVGDLVTNLLYYDRKEDEDLPQGAIQLAVERRVVTVDQMVEKFREGLIGGLS